MKNNIEYSSFSGTILFKWNRSDFPKISQILNLIQNKESQSTTKTYYKNYKHPYNCKLLAYESGRMYIFGAHSLEAMRELLDQCVIMKLVEKLPEVEISILDQLSLTNSHAKFSLSYQINTSYLQSQIRKQFNLNPTRGKYTHLPKQIHQVEKISVQIGKNFVKITSAHLISDMELFIKYLEHILQPFNLANKGKLHYLANCEELEEQQLDFSVAQSKRRSKPSKTLNKF